MNNPETKVTLSTRMKKNKTKHTTKKRMSNTNPWKNPRVNASAHEWVNSS